ncbi:MAG: protein kinase [Planctomycetaceae bacterium]
MRRPSDNLIRLLTDLDVCGEEDVAACETAVRNLCHELPDFDSVWVDALVQNGVLTAWQAEILESETPERIRAGEYLILSSCGDWTFRAVSVQNRRHVLLRRIAGDVSAVGVRIRQWQRLLDRLDASAGSAVPSLNLPRQLVISNSTDNTAWIASAFVPGWAADELLVRGGRIPWFAVAEIGEQLLAAVEWLHQHQLTHGDIRCSNLRLRADGHAVLVSPFVKGIEQPNLTFTNQLRLQDVETIAPERIASGSEATPASDLYAVGCVLWQLLAGRAPFLSADPVRRALQGQQRDVADVRTLVPDCPDAMAQLLAGLTRRHPDLRPSTGDALRLWREQCTRKSGTSTAVRTRSLLKQLPEYRTPSAETVPRPRRRASRVPTVLASAAMVVAFAAVGVYRGVLPMPLSVAVKSLDVPTEAIAPASNITAAQEVTGPLILPEPDAAGVIVLESGRTYVGSAQKFPGVVHIETSEAGPALVQVSGDQPWRFRQLRLS